jgi:hypothetical protein
MFVSLLATPSACLTSSHGGTWSWEWEGFHLLMVQPSHVVFVRASWCTLGDAHACSSNVEGIEPARGQVVHNPGSWVFHK